MIVEKFLHFCGDVLFDLILSHLLHLPAALPCQEKAQNVLILCLDYYCVRVFVVIDLLGDEVDPTAVVTPKAFSKANIQFVKVPDAYFFDELVVFFGEGRHKFYEFGFEDTEW